MENAAVDVYRSMWVDLAVEGATVLLFPVPVVPWNLASPTPTVDTFDEDALPYTYRPLSFWYAEWDDLDDFGADTW